MRLASCLIRVGMPYISTFLPSKDKSFWGVGNDPWPSEIPLNANPSQSEIREAEEDLQLVAKDLKWRVNDIMYREWGYMGYTRAADPSGSWKLLTLEEVDVSDRHLMAQGRQRRPLVIGIMKEYLNAIRDSDPASEQHLRASFMAGITMAHEIGHAIFLNDFRSFNRLREPYAGSDCQAELGFSFISWIFSGWHPQYTHGDLAFRNTLYWDKQYTLKMPGRPLYKTYYSIPISYVERVMSQEFWDSLGSTDQPQFSERARKALKPNTDGQGGPIATGTTPNWEYSHLRQRPLWKMDYFFRMPGFKERDRITGLADGDIQEDFLKTMNKPQNRWYATLSQDAKDKLYREMRRRREGYEMGYDTDELDYGQSLAQASKATVLKLPKISKSVNKSPQSEDSDDEPATPTPKLSKSMSKSQPSNGSKPTGAKKETIDHTKEATKTSKEIIDLTKETVDLTIEDNDEELPNHLTEVARLYHDIAARVGDLDAIVYEPSQGPRNRRKRAREMMEDIIDYREAMDIESTEQEAAGRVSRPRKRRETRSRPPSPPSYMQDIYDQIDEDNDTR
jgi:hypothetical protein